MIRGWDAVRDLLLRGPIWRNQMMSKTSFFLTTVGVTFSLSLHSNLCRQFIL